MQYIKKGLDLKIHIFNDIYNIKGKLTLYVIVANYSKKYITFNKGQCIEHMEPIIDRNQHLWINVTTQKMMDDHI